MAVPETYLVEPVVQSSNFERPSAGYSITVKLQIENQPGNFARVTNALAREMASLAEVTLLSSDFHHTTREVTINCRSENHIREVVSILKQIPAVTLLEWRDDTFALHDGGKISVVSRSALRTRDDLSRAYTPGVARVCLAIHSDPMSTYQHTIKRNTVAVVSDGSAVLGLGNIGPRAAIPVMEGKAVLFKEFAGVDAFPICLDTQDTEEIIRAVKQLAPVFGGINLEDISAPRCFEIEQRLRAELDIPVFHDDQHGTAIVTLAGLMNALKIVGKKLSEIKVVVNGFGAGGVACTRMMLSAGVKNIIPCDTAGIVYRGRKERMNSVKEELLKVTNPENERGTVSDALRGADVFVGVSSPGAITRVDVERMAKDPIVFALANPTPEILPGEIRGIARVIATGRSDYANQVNNALCFPGIFRGALDTRASDITDGMKIAAAEAIAGAVPTDQLREEFIIPSIFDRHVADLVAERVREAAKRDGVARL
jgi:malate dehydrogenase (oxaloacetate-decarboxylating)